MRAEVSQVELYARAMITLRIARQDALRARYLVPKPPIHDGCIVAVGENYFCGTALEISAVAFDANSWSILAIFDERETGVDELIKLQTTQPASSSESFEQRTGPTES